MQYLVVSSSLRPYAFQIGAFSRVRMCVWLFSTSALNMENDEYPHLFSRMIAANTSSPAVIVAVLSWSLNLFSCPHPCHRPLHAQAQIHHSGYRRDARSDRRETIAWKQAKRTDRSIRAFLIESMWWKKIFTPITPPLRV